MCRGSGVDFAEFWARRALTTRACGGARESVCVPRDLLKAYYYLPATPGPVPAPRRARFRSHSTTARNVFRSGVRFRPSGATATPRCPRTRGGRLRRREPRPNMRPTRRVSQLALAFPGGLLRPVPVRRRFRRILGASCPHHQSLWGGRESVCVPRDLLKAYYYLPATPGPVPAPRRARFRSHSTTARNVFRSGVRFRPSGATATPRCPRVAPKGLR